MKVHSPHPRPLAHVSGVIEEWHYEYMRRWSWLPWPRRRIRVIDGLRIEAVAVDREAMKLMTGR